MLFLARRKSLCYAYSYRTTIPTPNVDDPQAIVRTQPDPACVRIPRQRMMVAAKCEHNEAEPQSTHIAGAPARVLSSVCRSSSHMRYVSGSLAATSRSRLIQPFRSARTSFTILHAQFLCEARSHHWFLYSPSAHPCAAVSSRLADHHGLQVPTVVSNSASA